MSTHSSVSLQRSSVAGYGRGPRRHSAARPWKAVGMEQVMRGAVALLLVLLVVNSLQLVETAPLSEPPTSSSPSEEPVYIHTFKNQQCQAGHKTKKCGMRELDRYDGHSVVFWKPSLCIKLGCQCLATQEIRRERRSIADNRTDFQFKRFRIFECI